MLWMMVIMSLPILGIALFFVLPWTAALPPYLVLLGFSGSFHWLMWRAMRLPVRAGGEKMVGSAAGLLDRKEDSGRDVCRGGVWQAKAKEENPLARGHKAVTESLSRLTLSVKRVDKVGSDEWITLLDGAPDRTRDGHWAGGHPLAREVVEALLATFK